ncbi:MBL fold metallo-hydrolase [Lutibaculum baratangense]|uniref:Metallo-beta-lactamase family protein n=1 Tax=Lutibaculum baratangense AMV1 TaxID=631454 RepID=V4TCH7_9HYPH|nr:MBL fold metallo-hydrolase [Lutibaculum baratangense]ESR24013.1 metallo-beta-lactamase family protein [Lutibaculum baratangense AMV1]
MVSFTRDFEPRYGEAVEIVPGVRRITARNPGPFTFRGTNTYLVGTHEVVMIDPGPLLDEHLAAIDRALGGARVEAVAVTHRHLDHTAAVSTVAAAHDAPVAAFPVEAARPADAEPVNSVDAARDRGLAVDLPLRDGTVLSAGEASLAALHTPGHASDHLCLALQDTGILFSADHVMGWSTTVVAPPDGRMRDYMTSLERLIGRDETLYLPGHGNVIEEPLRLVRGLHAHRRQREAGILGRLAAGDRTISDIVAKLYQGIDPGLHNAAALSVQAHLEDLVERGLVDMATSSGRPAEFHPI